MGCGGSRDVLEIEEKGIHAILDHKMIKIGLERIDEYFSNMSLEILKIETFRVQIVDNLDHLILSSGACVYKNPTLRECILGTYYKLATDLEGKLSESRSILVSEGENLSSAKCTEEAKNLLKQLKSYTKDVVNLIDKVYDSNITLKTELDKEDFKLEKLQIDVTESFQNQANLIKIKTRDIKRNLLKGKIALKCVNEIEKEMKKIKEIIHGLYDIVKDLSSFDSEGLKAFQKKITKPHEIVWLVINEDKNLKFGEYSSQGYEYWSNRIKNKKKLKSL
jgi:hypothetical protein